MEKGLLTLSKYMITHLTGLERVPILRNKYYYSKFPFFQGQIMLPKYMHF